MGFEILWEFALIIPDMIGVVVGGVKKGVKKLFRKGETSNE